jgi:hypothetical protein
VQTREGGASGIVEGEVEKRASKTKWKKPKGIKVIALIFCKNPSLFLSYTRN